MDLRAQIYISQFPKFRGGSRSAREAGIVRFGQATCSVLRLLARGLRLTSRLSRCWYPTFLYECNSQSCLCYTYGYVDAVEYLYLARACTAAVLLREAIVLAARLEQTSSF